MHNLDWALLCELHLTFVSFVMKVTWDLKVFHSQTPSLVQPKLAYWIRFHFFVSLDSHHWCCCSQAAIFSCMLPSVTRETSLSGEPDSSSWTWCLTHANWSKPGLYYQLQDLWKYSDEPKCTFILKQYYILWQRCDLWFIRITFSSEPDQAVSLCHAMDFSARSHLIVFFCLWQGCNSLERQQF